MVSMYFYHTIDIVFLHSKVHNCKGMEVWGGLLCVGGDCAEAWGPLCVCVCWGYHGCVDGKWRCKLC